MGLVADYSATAENISTEDAASMTGVIVSVTNDPAQLTNEMMVCK